MNNKPTCNNHNMHVLNTDLCLEPTIIIHFFLTIPIKFFKTF